MLLKGIVLQSEKREASKASLHVMQEMGLEPTRYCYHRHLKPARLPIPPLLRTNDILSNFLKYVNRKNNLKKSVDNCCLVCYYNRVADRYATNTDARKCRNWQTSKTKDLVIIAIVWVQVPSSALLNLGERP